MSNGTLRLDGTGGSPNYGVYVLANLGLQSINAGVQLGTSQTWNVDASSTLSVGTNLSLISQVGGATSITKTGAGTLILGGNNSFTGGMTLNGGTTIFRNPNATASLVSGTINVNATATLQLGSELNVNNAIGSGVALNVSGGTVTSGNQTVHNLYSLTLAGGTISAGTTSSYNLNNPVTSSGTSAISAPLTLNAANRSFDVTSGALTVSGTMSNGTVTSSVTKTGTGTLAFTATQTYSGGTTVNQGTLQLGATNVLPAAGAISLAGGALSTGATTGNSNNVGQLSVPVAGSQINLGTGAHTLQFASFNATGFSGLTINGWAGSYGNPGTGGKVTFSNTGGLSGAILAQITFTGFPGGSTIVNNELVPVPEPVTVLGLSALGLGLAGTIRRARRRTTRC